MTTTATITETSNSVNGYGKTSLRDEPPVVGSNQGKIKHEHIRWMRPTSKDTPMEEMRSRLKEDGYLFVKHLLPREDVLKVRADYFDAYRKVGILEPGTSSEDGIFCRSADANGHGGIGAGELPPTDEQVQVMTDSHVRPEYLRFLEHDDLRSFVRNVMGWDQEVLLKRTMLRHNVPGGLSTAVHYDKLFLRDGSAYFLTAWVPFGDISVTGGGLMYLSNSSNLGQAIEDDFSRRAADMTKEERINAFNINMEKYGQLSQNAAEFHEQHDKDRQRYWMVTDYEAGDVVFHDPMMIHSSSFNEDPENKIRLSTDLRFYRDGSDLDKRWMKFWTPGDGL